MLVIANWLSTIQQDLIHLVSFYLEIMKRHFAEFQEEGTVARIKDSQNLDYCKKINKKH